MKSCLHSSVKHYRAHTAFTGMETAGCYSAHINSNMKSYAQALLMLPCAVRKEPLLVVLCDCSPQESLLSVPVLLLLSPRS